MSMTQQELNRLMESFKLFDRDGDGVIDLNELDAIMRSLGESLPRETLVQMIQAVDDDQSGTITLDEFVRLMASGTDAVDPQAEILEAFKVFDVDGNGTITADELKQVMGNLGHPITDDEVQAMIARVDTNADGKIDYNEFVRLMESWG